jgi:hypothetical protein
MYPRNAASPPRISVGPVVQISDGAVQTSGCTVRILAEGGAEGDGGGTTAYSTDGIVLYTPTQAETNYTAFVLIAKKTGCIPATVTVVTTAAATPGTVKLQNSAGNAGINAPPNFEDLAVTDTAGNVTAGNIGAAWDASEEDHTGTGTFGKRVQTALPLFAPGAENGLICSGTAAGQLYVSSGYCGAYLMGIQVGLNRGTLTGTPTNMAASFTTFVNVSGGVLTLASVNQTADVAARIPYVIEFSATGGHNYVQCDPMRWRGTDLPAPDTSGYPKVTIKQGVGTGEILLSGGYAPADLRKIIGTTIPTESVAGNDARGFAKLLDVNTPLATVATAWAAAGTGFDLLLVVATELATMLEADGPLWRFTVNALEQAPAGGGGGGGDWTADQKTAILAAVELGAVLATLGNMVQGSGENCQFTGVALALAPTGATASYSVSSVTVGEAPHVDLVLDQHAVIGPVSIVAEVAQTGDSHALLVYDPADPATVLWSLTTAGSEISVGGADDKTLTIADDDTHTASAGVWAYVLRNTTDDTVVCRGSLTIEAGPDVPTPP